MTTSAGDAFNFATAPTISLQCELARVVSFAALKQKTPPAFLYTSGKLGRFNIAGVDCVYFSESEETARAEYEAAFRGLPSRRQPRTTYFARVRLAHVLDLTNPATLDHLSIDEPALHASWRGADRPTVTQLLGELVSRQRRISAIRYSSVAALDAGFAGANVVIFRASLAPGDRVEVIGPDDASLDRWTGQDASEEEPGRRS